LQWHENMLLLQNVYTEMLEEVVHMAIVALQ
jgi:hypothetical protein